MHTLRLSAKYMYTKKPINFKLINLILILKIKEIVFKAKFKILNPLNLKVLSILIQKATKKNNFLALITNNKKQCLRLR